LASAFSASENAWSEQEPISVITEHSGYRSIDAPPVFCYDKTGFNKAKKEASYEKAAPGDRGRNP